MAKQRYVGQMISSRGIKKVLAGTVVRYEPYPGFGGVCSIKTTHSGWVSQCAANHTLLGHDRKVFRILFVGDGRSN